MKTFAKLQPISREKAIEKLTQMVMCEAFPTGCDCQHNERGVCAWCSSYARVRRSVRKVVNRIEADKS